MRIRAMLLTQFAAMRDPSQLLQIVCECKSRTRTPLIPAHYGRRVGACADLGTPLSPSLCPPDLLRSPSDANTCAHSPLVMGWQPVRVCVLTTCSSNHSSSMERVILYAGFLGEMVFRKVPLIRYRSDNAINASPLQPSTNDPSAFGRNATHIVN